jgi:tetratricopeptide (TPR) repeat protein
MALDGLADALAGVGEIGPARGQASRSLVLHKTSAERPGATAYDVNSYAWRLLTVLPSDLRDARAALRYAKRAEEITEGKDVDVLDTLALAHHMSGDQEAAIATAQRALDLLPVGAPRRRDLEAALGRFKASRQRPRP